ncbi:MAG TPA: PQQ-binding-like beta-propeller repeat protein, partial [Pyrinomonadaceae bacterium]|nr:PQQ-binding-like beta-propeller repeat protein [Pyrinomonadaceae bacterium]
MRVLKILLLILSLAFAVMAQDTPADNWAQFRGNHSLTGVSQSNVPASLKPVWTYEAGEAIESSAAIVGGTVFVGSQKGDKGELVALS